MTHTPRKRFGQHFLADRSVLAALVAAIAPRPGQAIVEIGPGLGALTERLLALVAPIDAVEIDRDLVGRLAARFGDRLRLHAVDALRFDFGTCAPPGPPSLRVVGNLPYNISTPLLVHLLAWRDRVIDQHFMLQKEVVDRIVAQPHSRDFGRLTVLMQAFYEVESLFDVPPSAFDPPPRVDSAVIRMRPRATPELAHPAILERLLAVAFSQRRKMLRSTLLPWLASQGLPAGTLPVALEPTARPEDLSVSDYGAIARALRDRDQAASRSINSIL